MSNTTNLPFPMLADTAADGEARRFANSLVDKYHAKRVGLPHLNTICIDLIDDFPAKDETMNRAISMLSNWSIDVQEYKCSSGRAGSVWMTPKFNVK